MTKELDENENALRILQAMNAIASTMIASMCRGLLERGMGRAQLAGLLLAHSADLAASGEVSKETFCDMAATAVDCAKRGTPIGGKPDA